MHKHKHTHTLSVHAAPCGGWALGVVCIQAQIKSEAGFLLLLPFTHAEMQTWLSFHTFTLSIPPSSPPSCHSVCLAQPFIRPPTTTTITTKKSYFSRCLSLVTQDSVPAVKRITCLYSVCVSCVCVRTCMCSDVCINVSVCLSVGCAEEGERGESTHRGPSASTSIIPIHLLFPLTPPQNVKGNY